MNRKVLLIAAGAAVALVAVWFLLLWSPQGAKLDAARERQAEAEDANGALALRIERLRDLRARRPELEADLVALRSAVPESPELDDFLLDTDAAADRAGVDITSVSPGKPAAAGDAAAGTTAAATPAPAAAPATAATDTAVATAGTPPSAISLSLDASGGYFQILDFINRLDDLPRIVVVDSLSLSGGGSGDASASGTGDTAATGGTGSSELTMSITARMFTTAPPAPPEGEAAEAGGATTTTTTTTTAPSGATAGGAGQ